MKEFTIFGIFVFVVSVKSMNINNLKNNEVKNDWKIQPWSKEKGHTSDLELNHHISVECIWPNKLIKGNIISIKKLADENYLSENSCLNSGSDQSKSIAILASETIIIDEDIFLPESSITLIAPRWEIIGNKTIDLSGLDGDHGLSSTDSCTPGKHGNPGLPGGPGGVLFGIGDVFINGQNLKIIANGGKGGTGEDGCPGKDGKDGDNASFNSDFQCDDHFCQTSVSNKFLCKSKCVPNKVPLDHSYGETTEYFDCNFTISGQPGEEGSIGGDGGTGGRGGQPGHVMLFELGEASNVRAIAIEGEQGKDGFGAIGGRGGKNGNDLYVSCDGSKFHSVWSQLISQLGFKRNGFTKVELNKNNSAYGLSGKNGGNSRSIKVSGNLNSIHNPSGIISLYKNHLSRQMFQTHITDDALIRFYELLENDNREKKRIDRG